MAKIIGTVFLKKINLADAASVSKNVTLKLISATIPDPADGNKGKVGKEARLEGISDSRGGRSKFSVNFDWNMGEMGIPGAFQISNKLSYELYLESLTFDDIPNYGRIHFACDSWISPKESQRTFFTNKAYLPSQTPKLLEDYRKKELETLRGNGQGERQIWERIYDYDVYNDLGNPDEHDKLARPILGGSSARPYPRRGRTGRPRTQKDPHSESIPQDENIKFYVPRDEEFSDIKLVEMGKGLPKVITQRYLLKLLEFQRRGIPVPQEVYKSLKAIGYPEELLLIHDESYFVNLLPFPFPSDFKVDGVQISDIEIAAEVLKVVNLDLIRPITAKPAPKNNLDSILNHSKFKEGFPGLNIDKAIEKGDHLHILDYHPHINKNTSDECYAATRTIIYNDNGTKRILAIELSVPKGDKEQCSVEPEVLFVPRDNGRNNGYLRWILAIAHVLINDSIIREARPITPAPFVSFGDVREKLFGKNFGIPVTLEIYNRLKSMGYPDEFLLTHGEQYFVKLQFPTPSVIKEDVFAWMTDEEFARQMLAGVNPNVIHRIKDKLPPNSELDKEELGKKLKELTKPNGLTVDEAIVKKKLFILDYNDAFLPYLGKIDSQTPNKVYATRTLLFLKDDGTLTPLAIELSVPVFCTVIRNVYYPAKDGVEGCRWLLAKAYVIVNDSGYHQLISHWLNTHAVIEPFVIATNRQLSVLHPVYKLLRPHFRDTMRINADARSNLINANGVIESSFFPGKYAMQMSSEVYKNWDFTKQALPKDLVERGMADENPSFPDKPRLVIKDYPYATDGLEIWNAIKTWVQDYVSYYYETNDTIRNDSELQDWWKELVEVGHGDLKNKPWWPKMQTRKDLIESCTIIIWIASALHAAVNFGQYPYGGYIINRPTLSKRLMPGIDELKNKEKAFLQTFTPTSEALIVLSILEVLSTHTSDEVYLGTRDNPKDWTYDAKPLEDFEKFKKKLEEIEKRMVEMNEQKLKNRIGPVKMPYTLLYPSSEPGVTGRGIPNSISI